MDRKKTLLNFHVYSFSLFLLLDSSFSPREGLPNRLIQMGTAHTRLISTPICYPPIPPGRSQQSFPAVGCTQCSLDMVFYPQHQPTVGGCCAVYDRSCFGTKYAWPLLGRQVFVLGLIPCITCIFFSWLISFFTHAPCIMLSHKACTDTYTVYAPLCPFIYVILYTNHVMFNIYLLWGITH